ncbi:DUF6344 domain-containing protein [Streptomyces sp. NBC_01317]|uniref:DUF6344 domain-containing protein n=1 Tax=Streptomyces sp. NBC_01317 TaxID=2903822 RepID=UPI002E132878|nr:DUF6344 domain-containing protein [Streptomyces sp. NBC_01317]
MAAIKVKKLWAVFITAFFAVLASLGLTSPATAAGSAVSAQPAEQPAPAPAVAVEPHRLAERVPTRAVLPVAVPRGRALPPTIKQRITAEAHGSSPSVRHLPAVLPTETGADDRTQEADRTEEADRTQEADRGRENAYAADAALVAA